MEDSSRGELRSPVAETRCDMTKQQLVLKKLVDDIKAREDTIAILLHGSVARGEERENSDIDIWIVKKDGGFTHSIDFIDGVKIDCFEGTPHIFEVLVDAGDPPIVNCFNDASVLYNNGLDIELYRGKAAEAKGRVFIPIETMPRERITMLLLQLNDAIDDADNAIGDKLTYNLLMAEIVTTVANYIFDFWGIWRAPTKDMLRVIKQSLPDKYALLEQMLSDSAEPAAQIACARNLLGEMAAKYGGLPKQKFILTEIEADKFGG